jgi:glycosyltransferase involved in cell wall biosynthesis
MTTCIFTSVVSNYIPKARVLAESVKRFHPETPFFLVLSDTVPPWLNPGAEPFDAVLTLDDLGIGNVKRWLFQHSLVEASTGVKGFALQQLLSRDDCSGVLYFDPDIVVLAPLDELFSKLGRHSVLLTPHLADPERETEAIADNEICSLKHGVFNLGFLGVSNSPEGRRFADWWSDRLRQFCFDDIPNGLFTDQRWADLAPAFFDQLSILRDPVYNVATWNLTNRRVEGTLRDGLTVGGERIVFYHFSGLDSGAQLSMLDKYGGEMPALYELRAWYLAECERKGQSLYGEYPWTYARFENGKTITGAHRRLYRSRPDLQAAFPDPYSTTDTDHSYYHWFASNSGLRVLEPSVADWEPAHGEAEFVPAAAAGEFDYRVFCSIEADAETGSRWLSDTLENTYNRRNLTVVAPEALIAAYRDRFESAGVRWMTARPGGRVTARLSTVLSTEPGDLVFVNSSVAPPPFWDLRLYWSAKRARTAATVSPLLKGARTHDEVSFIAESASNADSLCYIASQFRQPSWNGVLADCCFVRARGGSLTDAQAFVDSATRVRFEHLIADHVCAELLPGGKYQILRSAEPRETELALTPPRRTALIATRQKISEAARSAQAPPASVGLRMRPRHLHVVHNWGGGLERWVQEYCRSDRYHQNLVLKSAGTWGEFGWGLELYGSVDERQPLRRWRLSPVIKSTEIAHAGYQTAIAEIIRDYGVSAIIVSSLVGHSLDVLRLTVPAIVVCHDYYPLCAAITLVFNDTVCEKCGEPELSACNESNPHNRFFLNGPAPVWLELRRAFEEELVRRQIRLIAPTPSVRDYYCRLAPSVRDNFQVIPHGAARITASPLPAPPAGRPGLRIVVLGSIAPHKGTGILRDVISSAPSSFEFHLVGCGAEGVHAFGSMKRVSVIPRYDWIDLPNIIRRIEPDLGLLVSMVPETFSYTLQELMDMGIPAVCTRIGSFADRIRNGENGFLAEVNALSILAVLNGLNSDRSRLSRVRENLARSTPRTVDEMLADYRQILPRGTVSSEAYFSRPAQLIADSDADDLTRALALAEARVKDLEGSLSWRISAPLRTMGRVLLALTPRSNGGRS